MLDSLDIVVLIVSFESRASVVRYASEPGLPGAVVADTQRELFAGYHIFYCSSKIALCHFLSS